MLWLEGFVWLEAMCGFALASMNCRRLLGYARGARTAARRAAAGALALVSAALALEALSFVVTPALESSAEAREFGVLAVRSALLVASGAITALLVRNGRRRL